MEDPADTTPWSPDPLVEREAEIHIRDHVGELAEDVDKARTRITNSAAQRGVLRSGAYVVELREAIRSRLRERFELLTWDLTLLIDGHAVLDQASGSWIRSRLGALVDDVVRGVAMADADGWKVVGITVPVSPFPMAEVTYQLKEEIARKVEKDIAHAELMRATLKRKAKAKAAAEAASKRATASAGEHAASRHLDDSPTAAGTPPVVMQSGVATTSANPRRVAVVHGRNHHAKDGMFAFLSALSLQPVDWDDAIRQLGKGAPHHREILDALFSTTQAVVALLTSDEEAVLVEPLRRRAEDNTPRRQARPNVWIEAGMALGVKPARTILVRFGNHDEPSDIDGLDYIDFDGTARSRSRLRERLEHVQCAVAARSDWLTAGDGDFQNALAVGRPRPPVVSAPGAAAPSGNATPKTIWQDLDDEERRLLVMLWRCEDTFMTEAALDANRHLFHWDAQRWNSMQQSLVARRKLLQSSQGYADRARATGWTHGWALTPTGKELVKTVESRGELEMPPAPPGPWKPGSP